jgi:hypothetical protein
MGDFHELSIYAPLLQIVPGQYESAEDSYNIDIERLQPTRELPTSVYLMALVTLFATIAIDVNVPSSLHLLQPIDLVVHSTVAANIPFDVRALYFDKAMSDAPIYLGFVGCLLGLGMIIQKNRTKGSVALALFVALNVLGAPRLLPYLY